MNNQSIVFMTKVEAKPDKVQDVLQASIAVAKAARAQAGCIDFRILRSRESSAVTVNFERWSSEEARNTFLAGPEVKEFVTTVSGAFVESPQSVSYQDVS